MRVETIRPNISAATFLTGAQFCDAFSVTIDDATLDARRAAERIFARQPRWVTMLMAARDRIVTPFGLKTEKIARSASNKVGFFPVLSETPERLVAGLDDKHLDFRVVIDVAGTTQRRVTVTTIVLTHNRLGRLYLAIITPFHRVIVRALLRQIAARDSD
jgi:hypothetical protein